MIYDLVWVNSSGTVFCGLKNTRFVRYIHLGSLLFGRSGGAFAELSFFTDRGRIIQEWEEI